MDTATLSGADYGLDEATDELLSLIKEDAETPSEGDNEEPKKKPTKEEVESDDTPEDDAEVEDTEDDEDEGSEEEDESEEGDEDDDQEATEPKDKSKNKVVLEHDANAFVKAKIDGKDVEIRVSDLTRLYGQEAALTRKSTETAEVRKAAEANNQKYVAGVEQMLERAKARFEPYSKIDWMSISKDPNMSADQAKALYDEASRAYDDVRYLETSLDGAVKEAHAQRHAELVKQGQEAWKVLSDEKTGIKGWGEALYGEITKHAVDNGMSADIIKNLVDPSAIKLLHKAMLYDKGKVAVTKTSKVNKTPKKIIKESAEPATKTVKTLRTKDVEKRFRETGSIDDATAALMARMGLKDD